MSGQLDCWGSCEKRVGLTVTFKTSRGANISLNTLIIRIENYKTAPASKDAVSCSLFGMYSSNWKMKHLQGWLILSSVSGFVRFCQMYACCNHHSPIKTGREFPVDSEGLSMFILSFCMFSQIFLSQINPTLCFKGEPSSFLSISVWQSFIFVFGLFKFAQFFAGRIRELYSKKARSSLLTSCYVAKPARPCKKHESEVFPFLQLSMLVLASDFLADTSGLSHIHWTHFKALFEFCKFPIGMNHLHHPLWWS